MLTLLDLFAGIGGFSYAAEHLVGGFTTKQFVEINPFCQRILNKHWPTIPIHSDVCTFTAAPRSFDVICGGFPCQDLSTAGKQAGLQGQRSGLFYEIMRLAREIQPKFIVIENVANLRSHSSGETFQEVLWEIASAGFDAEWACVPAADVGACHKRDRIWIIAYPCNTEWRESSAERRSKERIERVQEWQKIPSGFAESHAVSDVANSNSQRQQEQHFPAITDRQGWPRWSDAPRRLNPDWRGYLSEPVLRRGDDGLSNRVDRLKALGNAVVPHAAAVPLSRVKYLAEMSRKQQDFEYRVRMHTRHGGTHDLFIVAPDAFTARMKALELCPHHQPQSILRVSDLVL